LAVHAVRQPTRVSVAAALPAPARSFAVPAQAKASAEVAVEAPVPASEPVSLVPERALPRLPAGAGAGADNGKSLAAETKVPAKEATTPSAGGARAPLARAGSAPLTALSGPISTNPSRSSGSANNPSVEPEEPARPAVAPESANSPPRALAPTTLEDETRLLREGVAALHAGNPAIALALLDEHAKTYPAGVLAEERSAERVNALCLLGRTDDARDAAAAFVREYPHSPLAARVRTSCDSSRAARSNP
jgi:hypothetical protein